MCGRENMRKSVKITSPRPRSLVQSNQNHVGTYEYGIEIKQIVGLICCFCSLHRGVKQNKIGSETSGDGSVYKMKAEPSVSGRVM
jgi:hypothetical protein